MLDRHQRARLAEGLVERYPTYDELGLFLDEQLGRALALVSAPDGLRLVVHRLVRAAQAQGWLGELVEGAAADSPHVAALQEARAALRDRPPDPVPDAVTLDTGTLDVAALLPARLAALADALRADRRIGRLTAVATAEAAAAAGADALVVGTDVTRSTGRDLPAAVRGLPVVLVATPAPEPVGGTPLAHLLAGSVTQIVVSGEPDATAARIVGHLAAVVGRDRRHHVPDPPVGGLA